MNTQEIPVTGFCGGYTVKREKPPRPNITGVDMLRLRNGTIERSAQSLAVEWLREILEWHQGGRGYGFPRCWSDDVADWLVHLECVELTSIYQSTYLCSEYIYEVTPAGMEFLRRHEAPEHWA